MEYEDPLLDRHFVSGHLKSLVLIACGLGLWLFLGLADQVLDGDTQWWDERILMSMRTPGFASDPLGPTWVEELFRDFTALGGVGVLSLLSLASIGYLWLLRMKRVALFVLVAIVAGLALSLVLKAVFDRPRPDLISYGAMTYTASFPSGHSMLSALVYLSGGAILAAAHRHRKVRLYIISCSVLLTTLVGLSRIYLGVHWPSDVLAGWAMGISWAAFCWLVAIRLQYRGILEGVDVPRRFSRRNLSK